MKNFLAILILAIIAFAGPVAAEPIGHFDWFHGQVGKSLEPANSVAVASQASAIENHSNAYSTVAFVAVEYKKTIDSGYIDFVYFYHPADQPGFFSAGTGNSRAYQIEPEQFDIRCSRQQAA